MLSFVVAVAIIISNVISSATNKESKYIKDIHSFYIKKQNQFQNQLTSNLFIFHNKYS